MDRETDTGTARADQGAWSLSATALGDGVQVRLGIADLEGKPMTAVLALDRGEARAFARALLAAAGDATERTFPHPRER